MRISHLNYLNELSPQDDMADSGFIPDDLAMFTNTQFFDFDINPVPEELDQNFGRETKASVDTKAPQSAIEPSLEFVGMWALFHTFSPRPFRCWPLQATCGPRWDWPRWPRTLCTVWASGHTTHPGAPGGHGTAGLAPATSPPCLPKGYLFSRSRMARHARPVVCSALAGQLIHFLWNSTPTASKWVKLITRAVC